jgi:hypothetical protein
MCQAEASLAKLDMFASWLMQFRRLSGGASIISMAKEAQS